MGRLQKRVVALPITVARKLSLAFHPDGTHLLSGNGDGVRRWRIADGRLEEVGKQLGMDLNAISVSRDGKRVVCGTRQGASVWDAEIQQQAIEVEGTAYVSAVDISPDATRFATGTGNGTKNENASIWKISTGKRLVGPLRLTATVRGIRFSPNGDHIATGCPGSIHIFDSRNGDQLITITVKIASLDAITPLAWSKNGQHVFVASRDKKIKSFDVSTGSLQAESRVHTHSNIMSIALAANGKFLATFAQSSITFWDTLTLTRIGLVVEDSQSIRSIALSPDCSKLATGGYDGDITIRNLSDILPDSYGPFGAPTQQQDAQPSAGGVHNGDNGLLEVELPSSEPAPLFDYDEAPSLASATGLREDDATAPGFPEAMSRSPNAVPITSPPGTCLVVHRDAAESSGGMPMVKKWLQAMFKGSDKSQDSHRRDRPSREPGGLANPGYRPESEERGNSANKGHSRMAAGKRVRRVVATSVKQPNANTKPSEASHKNKETSSSGQGHTDPTKAEHAQQVNDTPRPLAERVYREPGDGTVAVTFRFPAWMCCFSTGAEDGKR